jgi:hypothetical protein
VVVHHGISMGAPPGLWCEVETLIMSGAHAGVLTLSGAN